MDDIEKKKNLGARLLGFPAADPPLRSPQVITVHRLTCPKCGGIIELHDGVYACLTVPCTFAVSALDDRPALALLALGPEIA